MNGDGRYCCSIVCQSVILSHFFLLSSTLAFSKASASLSHVHDEASNLTVSRFCNLRVALLKNIRGRLVLESTSPVLKLSRNYICEMNPSEWTSSYSLPVNCLSAYVIYSAVLAPAA